MIGLSEMVHCVPHLTKAPSSWQAHKGRHFKCFTKSTTLAKKKKKNETTMCTKNYSHSARSHACTMYFTTCAVSIFLARVGLHIAYRSRSQLMKVILCHHQSLVLRFQIFIDNCLFVCLFVFQSDQVKDCTNVFLCSIFVSVWWREASFFLVHWEHNPIWSL